MCISYWFSFSSWNTWIKTQISVSRDRVQLWTISTTVTIKTQLISVKEVLAYWLNYEGFPGGSVVKNPPANAGDMGLIPGPGRSPTEENGNPLQYSCLENSMDSGAWWATAHGVIESWTWMSNWACMHEESWRNNGMWFCRRLCADLWSMWGAGAGWSCVVVTALHTGCQCPQQEKSQVLLDIRPPEKQLSWIC